MKAINNQFEKLYQIVIEQTNDKTTMLNYDTIKNMLNISQIQTQRKHQETRQILIRRLYYLHKRGYIKIQSKQDANRQSFLIGILMKLRDKQIELKDKIDQIIKGWLQEFKKTIQQSKIRKQKMVLKPQIYVEVLLFLGNQAFQDEKYVYLILQQLRSMKQTETSKTKTLYTLLFFIKHKILKQKEVAIPDQNQQISHSFKSVKDIYFKILGLLQQRFNSLNQRDQITFVFQGVTKRYLHEQSKFIQEGKHIQFFNKQYSPGELSKIYIDGLYFLSFIISNPELIQKVPISNHRQLIVAIKKQVQVREWDNRVKQKLFDRFKKAERLIQRYERKKQK